MERLKYLLVDHDRHGNERRYVRMRGVKLRIRAGVDSPGFRAEYEVAVANLKKLAPASETQTVVYVAAPQQSLRPVKIGMTDDPTKRLNTLQTGNPNTLTIVAIAKLTRAQAVAVERSAHIHFKDDRMTGEWFDISLDQAAYIVGRLAQKTRFGVSPDSQGVSLEKISS